MINFYVLSLFPELFETFFNTSIVKKGFEKQAFSYVIKNFRENAVNNYGQVDDAPYGGGAGMLLRPEPIFDAYKSLNIPEKGKKVLFFSPKGKKISHKYILDLTKRENIVLICGHYEGVDQRVLDTLVDDEVSLGDFVLSGGEIPAMALMDAVIRQLDGVIKKGSLQEESFTGSLLEYRQYTRPAVYQGMSVPEVLTSGNHKEIEKFKLMDSIRETLKCRPDLFDNPECYRSISERYQGKESIESLINKIKRELNDVSDNKNGTNTY